MGRMVTPSGYTEQRFIPTYRVTFEFSMMPTTKRVVTVSGNERLHLYGQEHEQVANAIKQAEVMLSLDFTGGFNVGPKVVKVEREWESEKGFDELICAYRVKPGMRVEVRGFGSDHPSQPSGVTRSHVTVGAWEGRGNGTARLMDDKGQPRGIYAPHDVFVVCQSNWA